ncbi:UNVERIFIED_CONTAM: hypothetical protein PYX00_010142 [Menopon gallinae]|uniref:Uncharacterized protein n=1 Tax=Menopon gallinae TaxID=328185 RepID=A0AAW2HDX1_9NEOP
MRCHLGSISNIDGTEYNCNKTQVRKVISGVVGAASSVTSIQVANLLRLFRIPQINELARNPSGSCSEEQETLRRNEPIQFR